MRIAFSCEKGGVGKTALAVCLARSFAERGMKVLFVDLDVQRNGTDALADCPRICTSAELFSRHFSSPGIPDPLGAGAGIACCSADPSLADLGQDDIAPFSQEGGSNISILEAAGYGAVIIDTPPTLGPTLATALLLAQQVLIPIEVELSSIQGAINVARTVANLRKAAKPDLKLLGVVVNRMRNTPRKRRNLEQIKADPGLGSKLIPVMIHDRDSIAESLSEVIPLRDLARKRTAARKAWSEIEALSSFVMSKTSD